VACTAINTAVPYMRHQMAIEQLHAELRQSAAEGCPQPEEHLPDGTPVPGGPLPADIAACLAAGRGGPAPADVPELVERLIEAKADHWADCLVKRIFIISLFVAVVPGPSIPSRVPASNRRGRRYRRPPPCTIGTPHETCVAKRCATQGPLIFILHHSSLPSNTILSYLCIQRRYLSSPLPCRHSRRRPPPTRLSLTLAPSPAASRVFWLAHVPSHSCTGGGGGGRSGTAGSAGARLAGGGRWRRHSGGGGGGSRWRASAHKPVSVAFVSILTPSLLPNAAAKTK
jgi:uncharacterized membrane protein YgcG